MAGLLFAVANHCANQCVSEYFLAREFYFSGFVKSIWDSYYKSKRPHAEVDLGKSIRGNYNKSKLTLSATGFSPNGIFTRNSVGIYIFLICNQSFVLRTSLLLTSLRMRYTLLPQAVISERSIAKAQEAAEKNREDWHHSTEVKNPQCHRSSVLLLFENDASFPIVSPSLGL